MTYISWLYIGALTIQALSLAMLLLWAFRWRNRFGLGFFVATVAGLNALELAGMKIVQPSNFKLVLNFGGSLLFSAKLFAVLLIYVREDAAQARAFLYGILAAALVYLIYSSTSILYFWIAGTELENYLNTLRFAGRHAFGMAILIVDSIVLILSYEWLSQRFHSVWLVAVLALALALSVDNTIYYLLYVGQTEFGSVLVQSYLGKWYAALIYGSVFAAALSWHKFDSVAKPRNKLGDVFDTLTFRQRFEALRERVEFDGLTGLKCRARFDEEIEAQLLRPGARLVIVDIDHFKQVNDRYGHLRGDTVLRDVAERIKLHLPESARAYRYGGEEFVVMGALDDAHIQGLRDAIARERIDGLQVTVSIGAAHASEAKGARNWFEIADRRLYQAKSNGRNRAVLA